MLHDTISPNLIISTSVTEIKIINNARINHMIFLADHNSAIYVDRFPSKTKDSFANKLLSQFKNLKRITRLQTTQWNM